MTMPDDRFEKLAEEHVDQGFLRELWAFLRENKKWWLMPMILVLLALGLLIALSGTAAAPFIYTLF